MRGFLKETKRSDPCVGDWYRLEGHKVVKCANYGEQLDLYVKRKQGIANNDDPHRVASSYVGDVHVSTVFLGLDHGFGSGPPIVFETMIFHGSHDGYQDRCSTWEEAEKMHQKAVAIVRGEIESPEHE